MESKRSKNSKSTISRVKPTIDTKSRYRRDWSPELSPQRLPNDDENYGKSPAAKHAQLDGSLDPNQTQFNATFHRKLKMRDTFTKIFPSYTHAKPTTYDGHQSYAHEMHQYPRRNDEGRITYKISREHTHKRDFMKEYHESMLKIADMRRTIK